MAYIPAIPGPATNWLTALDLDFSAQGSQSLNTDTNFTIGGLIWTKVNSAGDSVAMNITNGSGLIITPTSATNISNSTFSGPTLRIPITSVIPNFTIAMPIRVWIWISSSNEAANFDEVLWGTYIPNSGFQNQFTLCHYRGFSGATNGWGAQFTVLNSNITVTATAVPTTANRVGMMYYPAGVLGGGAPLLTGTTVTGGVWPGLSSLVPTTAAAITAASSAAIISTGSGTHLASELNFFITAIRAASGTAFTATIARFRVDYLPIAN